MADAAVIEEIARRLAEAVPARSRVLLFGSHARGEQHANSDVDVLVIEPTVASPMEESVRLRRELDGLRTAIDVVVVSEEEASRRGVVRGTMIERALREGRVLVDA